MCLGSNVPNVPMDPNLGGAQAGAYGGTQGLGAYTQPTQQIYYNQAGNPYGGGAITGATQAGTALQQGGQATLDNAGAFTGAAQGVLPYASEALTTGFDPQLALYGQEHQANTDFTNAALSQRGLGATPWGAGVSSMSDQYFNTNWLQTQLNREQTGANTAAGLYGAGEGLAKTGAGLYSMGAGQIAEGGALPYQVSTGINRDLASFIPYLTSNQQNQINDYLNYYGTANQNTQNAINAGRARDLAGQYIGTAIGSGISSLMPSGGGFNPSGGGGGSAIGSMFGMGTGAAGGIGASGGVAADAGGGMGAMMGGADAGAAGIGGGLSDLGFLAFL